MAELADARDSKSRPGDRVWVRFPPPAVFSVRIAYIVLRKKRMNVKVIPDIRQNPQFSSRIPV